MGRNDILKICAGAVVATVLTVVSCGSGGVDIPPFDAARAYGYLERQVAFGPRIPGATGHAEARDWIDSRLRECTEHVSVQSFTETYIGAETTMFNIVASFYPEKKSRVLLCAHWDTRPWADRDPDPANHQKPVPGANDGASGVAVLLEVARAVSGTEPPVGVDIVFFDGEDGGGYGDDETWILGSRHFADTMPSGFRPKYAVLLDMIGDSDLGLSKEYNSILAAPGLWQRMVELCDKLSIPVSDRDMSVLDDHIPLIRRGIPSIDLIDFDYPPWHTVSDTPDKCSAESLEKIGKLVLSLIYGE